MSRFGSIATQIKPIIFVVGICFLLLLILLWWSESRPPPWTQAEKSILKTLNIANLPVLKPDPSNAVADNLQAAKFGQLLFFDTRLSGNGKVACATCHQPQRRFSDGLSKAVALGQSQRNTPSIVGSAYSPWLYWDGRKDSQWSQALSPLEDPAEQGSNRMYLARLISNDSLYSKTYVELFGELPDFNDTSRFPENAGPMPYPLWNQAWLNMTAADQYLLSQVFANLGKVLAAYERKLMPGPARFDEYVNAVLHEDDTLPANELFNSQEIEGLRLFIGEAGCLQCHNGPLLSNNEFHNTGLLPFPGEVPDQGRSKGVEILKNDPFNCLGPFSDEMSHQCQEFTYMRTGSVVLGSMRTPSLRNLGGTAPYMHKGQLSTLAQVMEHYNAAPLALIGHNEAKPLGLSKKQLGQLELFLNTLDAPLSTADEWLLKPDSSTLGNFTE
jgi:cytochrome c peroxidase